MTPSTATSEITTKGAFTLRESERENEDFLWSSPLFSMNSTLNFLLTHLEATSLSRNGNEPVADLRGRGRPSRARVQILSISYSFCQNRMLVLPPRVSAPTSGKSCAPTVNLNLFVEQQKRQERKF